MQIQFPKLRAPFDQGPTVHQTYVFPVNQPDARRVALAVARQEPPNASSRPYVHQGATIQQTFPVPVWQPRPRATAHPVAAMLPPAMPTSSIHQAPVTPQVFTFAPRPIVPRYTEVFIDVPTSVQQGPTAHETFEFRHVRPVDRWWVRQSQLPLRVPLETLVPAQAPQTYEFRVSQPQATSWLPVLNRVRYVVGARPIVDLGATTQQTYVFALSQPVAGVARRPVIALPVFDVVAAPEAPFTNVFATAQPPRWMFERRQVWPSAVFRPIEGPTTQQTYVFQPNQPEFRRYTLYDPNRYDSPALRLSYEGFIAPPTVFTVTKVTGTYALVLEVTGTMEVA
jgi:hypothetical protein